MKEATEEITKLMRVQNYQLNCKMPPAIVHRFKEIAKARNICLNELALEIMSEHLEEHAPDLERLALLADIRRGEEAAKRLAEKDAAKAVKKMPKA